MNDEHLTGFSETLKGNLEIKWFLLIYGQGVKEHRFPFFKPPRLSESSNSCARKLNSRIIVKELDWLKDF